MAAGEHGGQGAGAYDVNGRPVPPRRWDRLRRAVTGGQRASDETLTPDDAALIVVAESADDALASSAALDGSMWRPDAQSVVRHLLALPDAGVDAAATLAALDGYRPVAGPDSGVPGEGGLSGLRAPAGTTVVVFARVQLVDAVHLSQERSRMASLASRHGGVALGWQILQHRGG
ncbi:MULTISPECIES: hypothetical protein [unclassified Gordonia (in: high G+C Gram-positive bacteria)]